MGFSKRLCERTSRAELTLLERSGRCHAGNQVLRASQTVDKLDASYTAESPTSCLSGRYIVRGERNVEHKTSANEKPERR